MRPSSRVGGWIVAAIVLSVATVLALQLRSNRLLQIKLSAAEVTARELAELRRRNTELIKTQPTNDELQRWRADREAMNRLRSEIESLQAARTKAESEVPSAAPQPTPLPLRPAGSWRNVGRATPSAAFETALWAAVGGDVDALAATLEFSPGAAALAGKIFATLPAEARETYATPEKLIAMYTARDIPTSGRMRIDSERPAPDGSVRLRVLFEVENSSPGPDAKASGFVRKGKEFTIRRTEADWKLVVPESAVERYGAMIAAPVGAAAVRN